MSTVSAPFRSARACLCAFRSANLRLAAFLFATLWLSLSAVQFPRPQGWVNDYAEVFDDSTKASLTAVLTELNQKTSVEIAVVSVKDFQGLDRDNYAVQLFETWGIGSKNDEGVLILLATEDREIKVEVGYGSEGYLTDGTAGQFLDDYVMPYLVQNDFQKGLYNAGIVFATFIADVKGVELTGTPSVSTINNSQPQGNMIFELVLLAIFIFLVIITRGRILVWLMLFARGGRGGGRGGMGGGFGGFGGGRSGGGGAGRRF